MILIQITLLFCVIIWLILCFYILIGFLFSTPYYPSRIKKLDKAFKTISKQFKLEDLSKLNFVDLGSGDGRTVLWAAKHGMNAEGIEINPFLTLISKIAIVVKGLPNAKIINKSFYKHNFSKYDIVYLYIYREEMAKLKTKLQKELKDGAIIISNVFTFDGQKPDFVIDRFRVYKINKS